MTLVLRKRLDKETKAGVLQIMREYFSRPSSVHQGKEDILWHDNLPTVSKEVISSVRMDDSMLLQIYHEACRRAMRRHG